MDKRKLLDSFRKKPIEHKARFIIEQCKGKSVLDIGCVGQDFNPENPDWLHAKIKKEAKYLAGVDINIEEFGPLTEKGYTLFTPEQIHLPFSPPDIILMADVIEHASDIISFLNFYKIYAGPETVFLVSTPNPYSIRQFFSILIFGKPGLNPEHTVAIDPTNMLEIMYRAELEIKDFRWLHEYHPPVKFYNKVLFVFYRWMYSIRKFWSPNFIVLAKIPGS